jgi:hypothetical protein
VGVVRAAVTLSGPIAAPALGLPAIGLAGLGADRAIYIQKIACDLQLRYRDRKPTLPICIRGHTAALRQLVLNPLMNAIDSLHSTHGRRLVRVITENGHPVGVSVSSEDTEAESTRPTSPKSSSLCLRPNNMEWEWGSPSAVRSLNLTTAISGHRQPPGAGLYIAFHIAGERPRGLTCVSN